MKKIIAIILFSCVATTSSAQLIHYISYNTVLYSDFFNKEKDRFQLSQSIRIPALSYRIEKQKYGVELFFTHIPISYYQFGGSFIPAINSKINIISSHIGLSFHYKILDKKFIKINPMLGIVKNWYDALILDYAGIDQNGKWWESILHHEKESKFGLLGGLNINVPVYKNIYTNTNLRYSVIPTAQYNKQNFIWEVGIGYILQRKTKR